MPAVVRGRLGAEPIWAFVSTCWVRASGFGRPASTSIDERRVPAYLFAQSHPLRSRPVRASTGLLRAKRDRLACHARSRPKASDPWSPAHLAHFLARAAASQSPSRPSTWLFA